MERANQDGLVSFWFQDFRLSQLVHHREHAALDSPFGFRRSLPASRSLFTTGSICKIKSNPHKLPCGKAITDYTQVFKKKVTSANNEKSNNVSKIWIYCNNANITQHKYIHKVNNKVSNDFPAHITCGSVISCSEQCPQRFSFLPPSQAGLSVIWLAAAQQSREGEVQSVPEWASERESERGVHCLHRQIWRAAALAWTLWGNSINILDV